MSRLIVKQAVYDYDILKPLFFEVMDSLGGEVIESGRPVLIKPNLLSPASPEQAVVTHPLIVRAAVEYVLSKGARPQISDSPGRGSFSRVIRQSGIGKALAGLDYECREFSSSVKVDIGEPFGVIDLAEDAVKAATVINLPKLKTHSQMGLTLGVKNIFGCVVGLKKVEWHLRAGVDRDMFTRLIVQIYRRIMPAFTILDGILAMEGEGPGMRGQPRHLGVLMGSNDAFALERAVCFMIGFPPDRLPILKVAKAIGLTEETVEIEGILPKVSGFRFPPVTSLVFGPQMLQGFIRRHLLPMPICEASLCQACAECSRICPTLAVSLPGKLPCFDYDRCIRCYCCIEICPHGALHSVESTIGSLFRKIATKR